MWCDATVRLILRNETYAGLWHYRKVDRCGTHSERRAPSERIAVNVPVVIDRDPWEKAQARLQYNKQMAMRNCKRQYLLRGMIRCGCGAAMIGQVVNGKYWYYVCTANPHKHTKLEHLCKERAVRCDAADQEAWGYVLNLFADRERFERALHQAQQAKLDALLPKRERLETVNGLLADCDKEAA